MRKGLAVRGPLLAVSAVLVCRLLRSAPARAEQAAVLLLTGAALGFVLWGLDGEARVPNGAYIREVLSGTELADSDVVAAAAIASLVVGYLALGVALSLVAGVGVTTDRVDPGDEAGDEAVATALTVGSDRPRQLPRNHPAVGSPCIPCCPRWPSGDDAPGLHGGGVRTRRPIGRGEIGVVLRIGTGLGTKWDQFWTSRGPLLDFHWTTPRQTCLASRARGMRRCGRRPQRASRRRP